MSTLKTRVDRYLTQAVTKMTLKTLQSLVQEVIKKQQNTIQQLKGDSNPQVVEVRKKAEAVLYFAEAVLQAINGRPSDLKGYAG